MSVDKSGNSVDEGNKGNALENLHFFVALKVQLRTFALPISMDSRHGFSTNQQQTANPPTTESLFVEVKVLFPIDSEESALQRLTRNSAFSDPEKV